MSKLVIEDTHGDGWNVWIGLSGTNPLTTHEGFVIGAGDTREAAIADAVTDLQRALKRLQFYRCYDELRATQDC